ARWIVSGRCLAAAVAALRRIPPLRRRVAPLLGICAGTLLRGRVGHLILAAGGWEGIAGVRRRAWDFRAERCRLRAGGTGPFRLELILEEAGRLPHVAFASGLERLCELREVREARFGRLGHGTTQHDHERGRDVGPRDR